MLSLVNFLCQNKSHWQHASKKQIHDYQTDLDKSLKSFTLLKGISCKEISTCSHRPDIATFLTLTTLSRH